MEQDDGSQQKRVKQAAIQPGSELHSRCVQRKATVAVKTRSTYGTAHGTLVAAWPSRVTMCVSQLY